MHPSNEATGQAPVLPEAGAGASCAFERGRADAAQTVRAEMRRWLAPGEPGAALDGLTLARAVFREVRWVGTHFLDDGLVADLATIRDRYRDTDPMLDAFLDCVLAKHDAPTGTGPTCACRCSSD